ncbi:MAG: glutamate ligase domain-containing protein, partial [Thermomicrobiales bacterium]
ARLLELSRRLVAEGGRVVAIVGTAGDRTDASLRSIGRIAAERSDFVIVKQTAKYLRGRTNEQIDALYLAGIGDGGGTRHEVCADELSAMELAVADAKPGDVIAIMCHEQVDEVLALLRTIGTPRD